MVSQENHLSTMEGPLEGTCEWEEQWVLCPCKLCKYQKRRRRRISLQHVQKHGEFNRDLILNPLQDYTVTTIAQSFL